MRPYSDCRAALVLFEERVSGGNDRGVCTAGRPTQPRGRRSEQEALLDELRGRQFGELQRASVRSGARRSIAPPLPASTRVRAGCFAGSHRALTVGSTGQVMVRVGLPGTGERANDQARRAGTCGAIRDGWNRPAQVRSARTHLHPAYLETSLQPAKLAQIEVGSPLLGGNDQELEQIVGHQGGRPWLPPRCAPAVLLTAGISSESKCRWRARSRGCRCRVKESAVAYG